MGFARALHALPLAAVLLASPAAAATVVDFENYSPGDHISGAPAGQPYRHLGLRGLVVSDPAIGDGNYLKLDLSQIGKNGVPIYLGYIGSIHLSEGSHAKRQWPKLISFDVYFEGDEGRWAGPSNVFGFLPGGEWHTLTFNELIDGNTELRFSRSQAYVDNFVYESIAGVVPEPATWSLMIAGFGFVGAALRRRTAARTTG